jgi:hypothetical protein
MLALSDLALNEFVRNFDFSDMLWHPIEAIEKLNESSVLRWELVKRPLSQHDAAIVAVSDGRNKLCVKVHVNEYEDARENYTTDSIRIRLNDMPFITSIIDVMTFFGGNKYGGKEYIAVTYPWVTGKKLSELDIEEANKYMKRLSEEFDKTGAMYFFGESDVVLTEGDIPVITDWNKFMF